MEQITYTDISKKKHKSKLSPKEVRCDWVKKRHKKFEFIARR